MADEEIKIKIKADSGGTLERTRKRIEEIKSAMLETEDVDTFNKLALEAGDLETEIRRTEDAVTSLSQSGSELTKMSTALGRVGGSLASLDFEQAAEEAGRFAALSKQMTFGSAIKSVSKLGKTFVTLGKSLLTNPLFLIVGLITGIIAIIVKLLDKLGVLKVIFEAVGDAIGWVVQQFKDLMDWIGLTSFAEDEAAEAAEKAAEKRANAIKRANASNMQSMEKELEIMKLQGASIEDIEDKEMELTRTRLANFIQENKADIARLKAMERMGIASEEQKDELHALMMETQNLTDQVELTAVRIAEKRKNRKKEEKEDEKEKNKAIRESNEKLQEDIANAQKKADEKIKETQISFIEDEIERDRQMAIFKENKAFEEIEREHLTKEQIQQLEDQHEQKLLIIEERAEERKKQRAEEKKKQSEEERQAEIDAEIAAQKSLQDQVNALFKEAEAQGLELVEENLQERKSVLKEALDENAITFEEYQQRLTQAENEAAKEREAIAESEANAKRQLAVDSTTQILGVIGNLAEEGSAIQKGAAVAQVIIDSTKGAMTAFSNAMQLGPIAGPIVGGTLVAGIGAMAAKSIQQILSASPENATDGGNLTPPSVNVGQQQQETPQMFFDNENIDQNAGGSVDRVTVVDYTDIEAKGKEVNKLQNRVQLDSN